MDRRDILKIGAAAGVAALLTDAVQAAAPPDGKPGDFVQAAAPPDGKPGDFDFLAGNWSIKHRRLKAPGDWDLFDGEATCWTILGGVGSVEELRIPARSFAGMGLRLLDVGNKIWSDFWVNAKSGVLTTPGLTGAFQDGAGVFVADDVDGDRPIKVRSVWDRITPKSCRWHQAVSYDAGKTWAENWNMDWTRI